MLGPLLLLCSSWLSASWLPAPWAADETSARWRCEPAGVEVGEPFALVLELEHDAALAVRELLPEAPTLAEALDESWVVLGAEPLASASAAGGRVLTRCAWRVASLEPGERSLADALAGVVLGEGVTRIQVGDARVTVTGLLAEGEDAPRPLRGFPEGFVGAAGAESRPIWRSAGFAAGIVVVLASGVGLWLWWRRRTRRRVAPAPTALERLHALETAAAEASSEHSRERCYELTRLLREAGDELCHKPRTALTDEEWLAAVHASLEIPRGVVSELEAVFERTTRVKYAGEAPTDWALQETFSRARSALGALQGGGGS